MIDYRVPMGLFVGSVAFLTFLKPAGVAGSLFISIGGVALWAGMHWLVGAEEPDDGAEKTNKEETDNARQ